jgi:hypothetical protein
MYRQGDLVGLGVGIEDRKLRAWCFTVLPSSG